VRNQWFQVIETRVLNRRTNSFAPWNCWFQGRTQFISTGVIKWTTYPFMANTIHFRTAFLFCICFLGDSIIAITLLSPCAVTALSTYTLQVRL